PRHRGFPGRASFKGGYRARPPCLTPSPRCPDHANRRRHRRVGVTPVPTVVRSLAFLLFVTLMGCAAAGPSPTSPSPPAAQSAPARTPAPKTLVVAALNPIKAFGAWTTNLAGGALAYNEVHSAGL